MPRLVSSVLAVLLVMGACVASTASTAPLRGDGRAGGPRKAPAPERRAPVVLALGDSYTMGIRKVTSDRTYAADVARALGWQIVIGGRAGTGFVATGSVGKAFETLFDEQLAWRPDPDLVLVSGGHNDVRYPTAVVARQARQLLEKIGQRWPRAQIVLMGPLWGGDPPPKALTVRNTLRGVAGDLRIPFVDPLAERWITGNVKKRTGNAPRYIRGDGTHPTPAGNRYIADRLVVHLRSLGLERPVLGRTRVRPTRAPIEAGTGQ